MEEEIFKDIVLLCKGWYNEKKYNNFLEAFLAYYKKYYGDFPADKEFVLYHFIIPCIKMAVRKEPSLVDYIFKSLPFEEEKKNEVDILFDRYTLLLRMSHGDKMGLPNKLGNII